MRRRFKRWFYDAIGDVFSWLANIGDWCEQLGDWCEQQSVNMHYQASEYDPPLDYTETGQS
jgi:hypothetical protein